MELTGWLQNIDAKGMAGAKPISTDAQALTVVADLSIPTERRSPSRANRARRRPTLKTIGRQ
jgi:hypothetical protein